MHLMLAAGRVSSADPGGMLEVTRSFLRGSIEISDVGRSVPGWHNRPVGFFGIWTSLYWIPYVLAGRLAFWFVPSQPLDRLEEFAVSFSTLPPAIAILAYLVGFWRLAGVRPESRRVGLIVAALGTPLFPYAKILGSEIWMALGLVGAVYHVRRNRGTGDWIAVGGWLAVALLSRKQFQLILPFVLPLTLLAAGLDPRVGVAGLSGVELRWREWRWSAARPRLLALAGPLLIGVAVQMTYNYVRFHHPLVERYEGSFGTWSKPDASPGSVLRDILGGVMEADFASPKAAFAAWWRMLVGFNRGIVVHNLVSVAALIWMSRGGFPLRRWVPAAIVGSAALSFLYVGSQYFWDGATSWGPRLFFYLAPLLALGLAPAWESLSGRGRRMLMAVALLSFLFNLPGALLPPLMVQRRAELDPSMQRIEPLAAWAEVLRLAGVAGREPYPWRGDEVLGFGPNQCLDLWWLQVAREVAGRRR